MSRSELSGKSILPIEPANNVSPVKTSFSPRSDMLPLLWPGVWRTFSAVFPNLTRSPSFKRASAGGE
jgi:hypothetical protein